ELFVGASPMRSIAACSRTLFERLTSPRRPPLDIGATHRQALRAWLLSLPGLDQLRIGFSTQRMGGARDKVMAGGTPAIPAALVRVLLGVAPGSGEELGQDPIHLGVEGE